MTETETKQDKNTTNNFGLTTYSYNVGIPRDDIKNAFKTHLCGPTRFWDITVVSPTNTPEPNTPEHSADGDLHITHPALNDDTNIRLTSQLHKEGDTETTYYTTYSVYIEEETRVNIPLSRERDFETALETLLDEANKELHQQTRLPARTASFLHGMKNI